MFNKKEHGLNMFKKNPILEEKEESFHLPHDLKIKETKHCWEFTNPSPQEIGIFFHQSL